MNLPPLQARLMRVRRRSRCRFILAAGCCERTEDRASVISCPSSAAAVAAQPARSPTRCRSARRPEDAPWLTRRRNPQAAPRALARRRRREVGLVLARKGAEEGGMLRIVSTTLEDAAAALLAR